jgi:hypothetical protein
VIAIPRASRSILNGNGHRVKGPVQVKSILLNKGRIKSATLRRGIAGYPAALFNTPESSQGSARKMAGDDRFVASPWYSEQKRMKAQPLVKILRGASLPFFT